MVNPSDFRDKIITGISIKYDWKGSLHLAFITLCKQGGEEQVYKLSGLVEFSIYDDFCAMHIVQVKMLNIDDQIYLSLAPYDELNGVADYDRDNFWFRFSSIEAC